jgi:hypothetical protein
MKTYEELNSFVEKVFKTKIENFFEALKLSPNALGYIAGALSEFLLKSYLIEKGFEVKRIREKWEGTKLENHHGDIYLRKNGTDKWYVLESKGVKSNSEKWHKLYNFTSLKKFMITHSNKIHWINEKENISLAIEKWIYDNLPKFKDEYKNDLYDYETIKKCLEKEKEEKSERKESKKTTSKALAIRLLKDKKREEINKLFTERLNYVMNKIRVLETHFVQGIKGEGIATPKINNFNLISLDLFLRVDEHIFVFANPTDLTPSKSNSEYLQQNYVIGFVFIENGELNYTLTNEWKKDFNDAFNKLETGKAIRPEDMQEDNRSSIDFMDIDVVSDSNCGNSNNEQKNEILK